MSNCWGTLLQMPLCLNVVVVVPVVVVVVGEGCGYLKSILFSSQWSWVVVVAR
eukprot:COSAG02_NODE_5147_length_4591_cov_7.880899_2_plen_53_part_00